MRVRYLLPMKNMIQRLAIAVTIILVMMCFTSCFRERRSERAGEKMQEFVVEIAKYAREKDADFIIIPQNGPELAYQGLDPESEFHQEYLAAVDGLGMEEISQHGCQQNKEKHQRKPKAKSSEPDKTSE